MLHHFEQISEYSGGSCYLLLATLLLHELLNIYTFITQRNRNKMYTYTNVQMQIKIMLTKGQLIYLKLDHHIQL